MRSSIFSKFGVGKGHAAIGQALQGVGNALAGVRHDSDSMKVTGSGDRLAVEGKSSGTLKDGPTWAAGVTPAGRFCNSLNLGTAKLPACISILIRATAAIIVADSCGVISKRARNRAATTMGVASPVTSALGCANLPLINCDLMEKLRKRPTAARKLKRREQQRAIDTRSMILDAALSEFAQRGFEAASIRRIAERTRLKHPLVTYHFRTKLILWRAVAEHAFAEIKMAWDRQAPPGLELAPIDRVRDEYRTFLRFTLMYPDFHHFMVRENHPHNPRLTWLTKNILLPILNERLLPQIRAAQQAAQLPDANPILIHYMLIGMTSVLCSLGDEIAQIAGISTSDPKVEHEYWTLIEHMVFSEKQHKAKRA
jgi:TetR/AcrR family transcriptional regulator